MSSEPFFRSRWVQRPEHVRELAPTALPEGYRSAGIAAGIKREGPDVGLLRVRPRRHRVRRALHLQRPRGRARGRGT